jgi:excinuclease ABC subunit C
VADVPDRVREKAAAAPAVPGVYLMKDREGTVIYAGKAKNLKSRIRSYFGTGIDRAMVPFLMARVKDIDYILTATEKEALILENTLIKKHRPRYNVMLRDDKNYFSIRLDTRADFPRFELVRRIKKDGARYFGPYASSTAVKETLRILNRFFSLRTCRDREFASRRRPCVEYQIKRCSAPCVGYISRDDYRTTLREAVLFIEGKRSNLLKMIQQRMNAAARALNFEEAARLRDRLNAVEQTLEKQYAVSPSFKDRDVFGTARREDCLAVYMMNIRKGVLTDQRTFPPVRTKASPEEALAALLKQYYDGTALLPEEVIIPATIDDERLIAEWLTEKRGRNVSVIVPKRGVRRDLLDLAAKNADEALAAHIRKNASLDRLLTELAEKLHLRNAPRRIECFDISTLQGRGAVGSMVVFSDGAPDRNHYRRYRIRTVDGADDYAMMYEVLKRRYADGKNLPDLIVIDGGRGQLGVALSVLKELDIRDVDVLGLAKETRRAKSPSPGTVRTDEDRVYLRERKNPLYLSQSPELLRLLQAARDEAHRFALAYHRKLRERENFLSPLDSVPGIGPKKKNALLNHFKSYEAIRRAPREELTRVPGIGAALADLIVATGAGSLTPE